MSPSTLLPTPASVSAWANVELWDGEYQEIRSIPSSHRLTPSRAFRRLEMQLPISPGAAVLDAGCGTGRHSLYLAGLGCAVHAIDSARAACDVLTERLACRPDLRPSVRVEHEVLDSTDLPDERYDLVIDSYASCHLLDDGERQRYLDALLGRLKPHGRLYTSYMGTADTYYTANLTGTADGLPIATDPLNGVSKLLQHQGELRKRLTDLGNVASTTCERFADIVAGESHDREVLAAVLHR